MATSGQMQGNHINIGGNGGNYFFINWQLASQSIEQNHSIINWQAYFHYNNADAQLDNGTAALSGTRWNNGGRVKNFEARFVTRDVAVASGSFTIGHKSDGAQSLSVSGGIDVYQSGRSQGATGWDLPTIPRNSQVTVNASPWTIGSPVAIYTNRKSASFTHTITIRHNNASGTVLKTINSVGDSTTWTPTSGEIATMEGLIPNSNIITLYINQYNNQVRADSAAGVNLSLTDANPTFSNFTFRNTTTATNTITGSDQVLVKGKSTLEVKVPSANKMVAIKSATPARYDVVYDGVTEQKAYSTSDVVQTFTPIASTGARAMIVRAYDSRGNSTAVTKSVTVYDYVEPNIEIGVSRENNFGANVTITTAGEFDLLPVAGVNKNSLTASSLKFRYREQPSGTWTTLETIAFTVSGNEFTGTTKFKVLDNTKSYDFEFQIADKFGTVTQTATLGAGVPLMFVGENGTVEIGGVKLLTEAGDQSIAGNLTVSGAVYSGGKVVLTSVPAPKIARRSYTASSTGTKVITGLGFKPRKITTYGAMPNQGSMILQSRGYAYSTGTAIEQGVTASSAYTSGPASEMNTRYDETIFFGLLNSPSGFGFLSMASLTSIDNDGITFNVITAHATFNKFVILFEE